MVNSSIKNEEVVNFSYPFLGKCTDTRLGMDEELIVLFDSPKNGTVVYSTCDDWKVGQIHENWQMSSFVMFTSEVVLKNI